MRKTLLFVFVYCFICWTYKPINACSMIYKPPTKFDSTEYIFIGKVIGYTGPLFSDTLKRSFQGLVVEITDPVYLPKSTSGVFKIIPYQLGPACELNTWEEKSFKQIYPIGTELRIVGEESVFIYQSSSSDSIILDVNPFNMFTLSVNFKEPIILFSTKKSIYDYRNACVDSNKSFRNNLSLYDSKDSDKLRLSFQNQYHYELRKDLYRLFVASSDLSKKEIIKRLFNFRFYSKKDFLKIINENINCENNCIELYCVCIGCRGLALKY